MPGANPYAGPKATVESAAQFQTVNLFSVSGRIGRALYVVYAIGIWLAFLYLQSLFDSPAVLVAVGIVTGSFLAVLTIQRCHDFDYSGWAAILLLIPPVNLVFWFIPGTKGVNRFGAPPPPNGIAILVLLWLFAIAFAFVVLVLIALVVATNQMMR